MIEDTLRTQILADGGISALVSDRYYPGVLPQDPTYPAIVSQKVSDFDEGTLTGVANVVRARVQLTVWASSYVDARAVTDAIRSLVDGAYGTWSGVKIGSVRIENDQDAYSEEAEIYGRRMDVMILYHR